MLRRYFFAALLGLGINAASAAFSYDYVEGGFGEIDEADSLFLNASKSIDKNLHVLGGVAMVDSGISIPGYDGDGFYVEGGLGYAMPLTPQADFFANAQVLYANFDVPGEDDDIGGIARAGLRFIPLDKVELEGSAAMSSNDFLIDDGFGLSASARYYFDPRLSAAVGWSRDTELDGAFLSVRYNYQ
jgi:hypothetical protein